MNNGNTQTGVSRERQANRLQTCRMSRTSTRSTVKCPQLLALARGKTKHFTFDGKSNNETMSEKQWPKLPATASSGAPTQQAQSKPLPHLQRTSTDRGVMTSQTPKIIFRALNSMKRKENKEAVGTARRSRLYCKLPNKGPKIFREIFVNLRGISEFH